MEIYSIEFASYTKATITVDIDVLELLKHGLESEIKACVTSNHWENVGHYLSLRNDVQKAIEQIDKNMQR